MKDEKFLTRSAFRLLALLLCLTASIPQMRADVTIFVRGTAPHIFVFYTNGTAPSSDYTTWPGVQMSESTQSADGTTWYYVNFEGLNSCSIIFNDGNGNQTENINNISGTNYFYSNGGGYYLNLTAFKENSNFVLFENTNEDTNNNIWTGTIKAYCWEGNYSNQWPGEAMTVVGRTNQNGKKIYAWYHANKAPGKIIFTNKNDGNQQTGDLTYVNGRYYYNNGNDTNDDYVNLSFPTLPTPVADTYVVAGPSSIFGSNWDGTASANTMTEGNDGTYTLTLYNVNLTASTSYEYKVVKNGSQWIPSGNNLTYNVPLNGSYNITFTFNPVTNTCDVTCLLQTATGGETYTVAGSNTTILGSEWGQNNTNNDMTLVNGVYQLTFNDVVLSDNNPSCEFRVVVNHSWVTAYPSGNANVSGFNGSGTYDIVFTYDPSNNSVTGVATKQVIYYVVGDEDLIGHDWAIGSDVVMTNNSWSKTGIHLNMGTYNLKVLDSDGNWYGDENGDNVIVTANENGTYTLTVTRDPNTGVVTASLDPTAIDATQTYNIYVRYTGNESPENVYMHAWNVVTEYDQMPGIKFSTMTTEIINGYLYYKYTIDNTTASSIGLLFNENGSDQTKTADLTAQPGNNYFTYGGGSTVSGPTTTPDESATYYITGSEALGLGWSHDAPTAMTLDQTTGHYTYTYEVTESGIYNFVFANGTSDNWDDFNTQHRIGPSGATDVSITPNNNWNNTQMANGSNKAYSVKLNPGTVTITFDPTTNNMRFKVDGHILTHNYTFYVLPSDHSTTPYMYLWGLGTDEAFHNDYPGTALTTTVLLDDGNYWHELNVDLTAEFIHALVNGGTPQDISNADNTKTADITHIDPGTYYIYWTTTREDGQQYNDYILTNVPPTHPGGTLYMIGTYYYDKHQYNYDPNSGVQMKYDANSQTYYLNNVNLAVNNTFCFTTNLSANWDNVGTRYGNGGPTSTVGDNTTNYFEINENYINKKLNLDVWNENYGEFRITVPGIYNVLVNPEGKWVQLIKTDYYALTPMNVFLEQTPNVTMPADFIQQPGTEYTNTLFNGGNWPLAAYNEANGGGQWDPTDNGNHYPVTFIGDTVTVDGKHWWHWQVNASIAEIFFTRTNEPNQSNIIRRKSGVLWVTWDEVNGESTLTDHSREYFEAAANALPTNAVVMEGHYYVYFINTVDWDKVYCYAWDNNPVLDDQGNPVYDGQGNPVIDNYFHDGYSRQMNDWPGQPCELVGIDPVTGYEVWRYDFGTIIGTDIPNGGIIFNDGNEYAETEAKEQTGDFEYINGAVYDYLGMVDGAYTLNNLIRTAAEEVRYTVSNDLLAVYYDPKAVTRIDYKNAYEEDVHEYITGALYAKDLNQYGEKSIMPDDSYTDYVYQTCASNHTSGRSQIMIKRTTYDQSNWVKLVMSPNYDNRHEVVAPGDRPNLEDYVGHIIPAGTLDVFMTDTINPTAHVLAIQMGETMSYEPNVYISSHFNDTVVFNYTHRDWQPDEYRGNYRTQPFITWEFNEEGQVTGGTANRRLVDEDPYYMYYVAPKPQEIAYITWVVYDNYNTDEAWPDYCKHTQWTGENGWSYQPYTTPNPHVTPPVDPGRFYAPMNWNRRTEIPGEAYDQLQYLAGDVLDKALGAWDPDYGPYSNGYMQYGAMKVNWSLFQEETPWWQIFTPGQAYKFMAIIRYARGSGYNPDPESGDIDDTADNYYYGPSIGYFEDGDENTYSDGHTVFNAPRRNGDEMSGYANMYFCGDYAHLSPSKFIIFPIKASAQRSNGDGMGNVTAVNEVFSDVTSSRTVVGVSYYNLMGVKSDKPFDGINIVVTTYSDGSCSSRKILR